MPASPAAGGPAGCSPSERVLAVTVRLDRVLRPRSLAFVGGKAAELAVEASRSLGFDGEMWAVNPRRTLAGLPTFASVGELPGRADAAFVGVGSHAAVEVVRELAAAGTGAAVCHASGFAETGEAGAALQADLLRAAAGMALLGPNCYGTLSALTGAALWPDVHGLARCERGVALVSQSGNIAVNLTMQRRGLGVACVMALGNQADVGTAGALEALVVDEAVTGVGLVIEAVDDVGRFAAAACSAQQRGVPVVALKLGASKPAVGIAITHTASLVGDDTAYEALFRRVGVHRVRTVPELLDTLAVLCAIGSLKGNRVVSLSCSGGEAALVADRGVAHGVAFPEFAPDHRDRVAAALEGRVAVTNPLDYHTFIWGDKARLAACFQAVLGASPATDDRPVLSPRPPTGAPVAGARPVTGDGPVTMDAGPPFDAALLVLDFPAQGLDRSRWWPTLDAFGTACSAARTPGIVAASMAENLPEEARARAAELGLAACGDIDSALAALAAAARLGRSSARPLQDSVGLLPPVPPRSAGSRLPSASSFSLSSSVEPPDSVGANPPGPVPRTYVRGETAESEHDGAALSEREAKQRLASVGVAVPAGRLVSPEKAEAAAREIGFPVVVKAVGIAHKTDTAGVEVGLDDPESVAVAARRLGSGDGSTVLVESFVTGSVAELLVSVRSAPPVGMLLTLGAGGTLTELLADTAALLLPAAPDEIRQALRRLRIWPLLVGHRGRPAGDLDAAVEAVVAVCALARDDPRIVEIEINPLIVTPDSAVAVDALMLMADNSTGLVAVGRVETGRPAHG